METNEALKSRLLKQAEEAIELLLTQIQTMEEGDLQAVEQQVLSTMMDLGRKCLEGVVNQQAQRRGSPARRVGGCGHRQRLVSTRQRHLLTLMGPIIIQRAYYQCMSIGKKEEKQEKDTCSHGEAPCDAVWGLDAHRSSPGVQRAVSYLAATLTQEEVAEAIGRLLPIQISARQVGHVIRPVGEAFEHWEDQQMQEVMQHGEEKRTRERERQERGGEPITRLYVEMDGVMTRMRRGSVPMEKQEQEKNEDIYREVKVGAVFVGQPGRERSMLAPGVFVDTPGPITYVARRTSADAFAPLLYGLAQRMGMERAQQVVVLADGAKWIWRLAEEQFPGAVQIVDEYHAREHIWEVARAVFVEEPGMRETWATAIIEKLMQGRVEAVIAAIEQLPAVTPPPGKSRSIPQIEAAYFRSNSERMRYPLFRAQGMHLGSGIAEAACKTVVSTRTKRSGMRWTPDGLAAVLALRTAVLNRAFDHCWHASRSVA
ncbi:MAG: ISKra4 family transposase [Ktedonobacteraceae bacterium]